MKDALTTWTQGFAATRSSRVTQIWIARHAATGERGQRRSTPILLLLRDHAVRIAEDPHLDLPTLLRSNGVTLKTNEPKDWWEQQLHMGRCLILLDGLDEVATEEHRRRVVDWVGRQVAQPANDYVVTSRPHGFWTATLTGATVLQVRPFTSNQVQHHTLDLEPAGGFLQN